MLQSSKHSIIPFWKKSLYSLIHGTKSRSTYNIPAQDYSFLKNNFLYFQILYSEHILFLQSGKIINVVPIWKKIIWEKYNIKN